MNHSILHIRKKPPLDKERIVLGVTGGIACGKSTICHFFKECGAAVISADELAREVVSPGSPAFNLIVSFFGETILSAEGCIDRKTLGRIIFRHPEKRQKLNDITHPAIAALAEEKICRLRNTPGIPLILYEAPLLFEAGAEKRVDLILVVTSSQGQQLQRLAERDQLSMEEGLQRIRSQMPLEEKISRADIILENNGPLSETKKLVTDLYCTLINTKKGPPLPGDLLNIL